MYLESLGDLSTDSQYWIQRCHRLLKNHTDASTTHTPHFLFGNLSEIRAFEQHLTICYFARGIRYQPHHRQRRYRLAAARFPDKSEYLTFIDVKRHAVYSLHIPAGCGKPRGQVTYLK
jgi:hypothetical protein